MHRLVNSLSSITFKMRADNCKALQQKRTRGGGTKPNEKKIAEVFTLNGKKKKFLDKTFSFLHQDIKTTTFQKKYVNKKVK